jgi:hypothetical protein
LTAADVFRELHVGGAPDPTEADYLRSHLTGIGDSRGWDMGTAGIAWVRRTASKHQGAAQFSTLPNQVSFVSP